MCPNISRDLIILHKNDYSEVIDKFKQCICYQFLHNLAIFLTRPSMGQIVFLLGHILAPTPVSGSFECHFRIMVFQRNRSQVVILTLYYLYQSLKISYEEYPRSLRTIWICITLLKARLPNLHTRSNSSILLIVRQFSCVNEAIRPTMTEISWLVYLQNS